MKRTHGSAGREACRIGRTRDPSSLALVRCLPPWRRERLPGNLECCLAVRAPERLRPGLVAERQAKDANEPLRRLVIERIALAVGRERGRVQRVRRTPPG